MSDTANEGVRRRKHVSKSGDGTQEVDPDATQAPSVERCEDDDTVIDRDREVEDSRPIIQDFLCWVNILIGLVVMVLLAQRYSLYLKSLHENEMWFSNIQVQKSKHF
jgi:hypothetical protein